MTEDPLDAVFDTREELEGQNRETLARMLIPFAVIDPQSGELHPRLDWQKLNSKQKVLVYLLSRLALSTKNPDFKKTITGKEVEDATELPGGTVRPKLAELLRDRVINRDKDGGYFIRSTSVYLNRAWSLMEDAVFQYEKANQN